MWNKTLKKIDHSRTPQKAASLWNADADSLVLISDGINLVYRFTSKGLGKYLRITHPTIRSVNELSSAIDYQRYLFEHGAPVCKPIISNAGNYIEEIQQADMCFLAHVTDEVPGTIMYFDYTDQSVYRAWGRALAILHKVAQQYQPARQFQFKTWRNLWQETSQYLPSEDILIQKEYYAIDRYFKTLTPSCDNFGLTHGDHRTANVLYDGKSISIIDFDEPVYHWFLTDIAKPFLELTGKPFCEWRQKFMWHIEGYRTIRPLSDEELRTISWFTRMKSLDIYLWCKYNWHNPIAPGGKARGTWLEELSHMIINPLFMGELFNDAPEGSLKK